MAITYIGSTLSISRGTPANDAAANDYAGLRWSEVGKVVVLGELGDSSEDVSFDLLKSGRKTHVNGIRDIGEFPVTVEFDQEDAGQNITETASDTNTTHSFRIVDSDEAVQYFTGVVANYRVSERTASQYKGAMFAVRGQSGLVDA